MPAATSSYRSRNALRWLAIAAALSTFVLIAIGGVVRVTGSGLGCGDDWPRCNGQLVPTMATVAQMIEYSHRLAAATTSCLILALAVAAWLWHRQRSSLVTATAILLLLVVQIALGAVVVRQELQPMLVMAHLGVAMLILGALTAFAAALTAVPKPEETDTAPARHYPSLLAITTLVVYAAILIGAYTRATGASIACIGFPGCSVPTEAVQAAEAAGGNNLVFIHILHRSAAYLIGVLVAASVAETWRLRRHVRGILYAAGFLLTSFVFQAAIGALMVSTGLPGLLRGLHVAGAAAVWSSAIILATLATRYERSLRGVEVSAPTGVRTGETPSRRRAAGAASLATLADPDWLKRKARAYLSLTKPKVILLLEIPTLAAMLVAGKSWPSPLVVVATLLGGAFAAGGAAAINCYIDRDIDALMGTRTKMRAIPAGEVGAGEALTFGLVLAVLSFLVLAVFTTILAAFLAQAALLIYVFIYTRWLKRSTPSNIVIGGAAGAIPPLVGWAAVTGEVGPVAWLLFAVIFFWTPPHFWALSLLIHKHYERANVPMLPVVRGEAETRRQIIWYTLQMICVTLFLFAFRLSGLFYLTAALVLGGIFLYLAARLWREATARAASRLFHYSMLYLWLLCIALVLDKRVFS